MLKPFIAARAFAPFLAGALVMFLALSMPGCASKPPEDARLRKTFDEWLGQLNQREQPNHVVRTIISAGPQAPRQAADKNTLTYPFTWDVATTVIITRGDGLVLYNHTEHVQQPGTATFKKMQNGYWFLVEVRNSLLDCWGCNIPLYHQVL